VFKEVYSDTHHLQHMRYLYFGLEGKKALVGWAWLSVFASVAAFFLFLVPATRRNLVTLNLGCVLILFGVYIEKSIGLVVPGYTPSVLGEIYPYYPTSNEVLVGVGILGVGALLFTLMSRVAINVAKGTFRLEEPPPRADVDVPA
jgi:molybdopterin-containing oxidoreductase family membrane subunit